MNVRTKRVFWIVGAILGFVLLAAFVLSFLVDEPLRAWMEDRMNRQLEGYAVRLDDVDVNPFGPSILLQGLTIVQEAHPDPPVADVETVDAGLNWKALLSGRIVGKVELDRPDIHVHLAQLREEAASPTEVQKRGWQEAVKAVYPLEINLLTVTGGELTYIDQDPQRPLRVEQISFQASNIRNVETPENTYPSPFQLRAAVFDSGRMRVEGRADFLSEPRPGITADIVLDNIAVDRFAPVLERYRVSLESGRLDVSGHVEISPRALRARLEKLHLQDLDADYIHTEASASQERKAVRKTREAAEEAAEEPGLQLHVVDVQVRGRVGMTNKAADPAYRVYMADTDLRIENLSNQFRQGPAELKLEGAFMGSGRTTVTGTFRPEDHGPDFDLNVKIEDTELTDMNDLLRAYGNFDVHAGTFSLFSEIQVKQDRIDGYVKPFFKNVDVYDRRQDEDKDLFRRMYEGLIGGIGDLLSRGPQDRVAARTEISGQVENPQADTWQVIVTIVQNAFFKAILPGFDQELTG